MTVMYSFCFWYSVRLGSIIVAFTCMLQCLIALIACGYGVSNLERTSTDIEYWLQTSDLKIAKVLFEAIRDDPKNTLIGFIIVLSIYFGSCILLIYAAFQCNIQFMYPFLILDFIRLVILSISLIVILMIVKENTLNLGVIIGCSISGGFTLLYLWYQWFCAVSLWQIIREIEKLDRLVVNEKKDTYPIADNFGRFEANRPFYLANVSI